MKEVNNQELLSFSFFAKEVNSEIELYNSYDKKKLRKNFSLIKSKLFTIKKMKFLVENAGFKILGYKKAHSFIAVIKLTKVSNIP